MLKSPLHLGIQLTQSQARKPLPISSPHYLKKRAFSCTGTLQSSKLQVGDRVILKWTQVQKGKTQIKYKLTRPLHEDGHTEVGDRGLIVKFADVIGKESCTKIDSVSKDGLRRLDLTIRHPTLDEFVSLAPRRVAPIYASYASTIVSMLDIHSDASSCKAEDRSKPAVQILEAGTGHGGLTLHLARAIAAANESGETYQGIRPPASSKTRYKSGEEYDGDIEFEQSEEMKSWRAKRNAVLHTVDIDPLNRIHADILIRSFRRALYWPHINFYTGDVKDWVSAKVETNQANVSPGEGFLDIAVLDMPGVEDYIESVTKAIKPGGQLLIFQPQITQIASCVQEISAKQIDLEMETVLELGEGISSGRHWDVKLAQLKSLERQKLDEARKVKSGFGNSSRLSKADRPSDDVQISDDGVQPVQPIHDRIPPMVCRPLVGEMTRGGGFVGLWRKA